MKLTPLQWQSAFALLDTALELPEPELQSWLETLSGTHPELVAPLRELLGRRAQIDAIDFLPPLSKPASVHQAGDVVGAYHLLQRLGAGGMGEVWRARRTDGQLQRDVAIKLPDVQSGRRDLEERFGRERAILSALEHPGIARLYDAGVTASGQPYLVLEYVEGRPFTEFCDEHSLSIAERLRLFQQVLQAVQFAHAHLVIHRDLKPANILVTTDGQVRLLDFGIAKLLDSNSHRAMESELTQIAGRALTPQYASPEQVKGEPVTTASDVYSLGVLLSQVLSGALPYELRRGSAAEMEEAILSLEPRPTYLGLDEAAATARRTTLRRLARLLRGDLSSIVLHTLAKDPAARYATVDALSADIERYLTHQPVLARGDSAWRRIVSAWRRNRLVFAAATAVFITLAAGLMATLWQAAQVRAEARRAEAVQTFLAKVLSYNNPEQAKGRELSARELLDFSAGQIDTDFANQPDVQAQLHHTVAQIYMSLGTVNQARPHLERALPLYANSSLKGSAEHVETLFNLSEVFDELRDYAAERTALEQATNLSEEHFGRPNPWSGRLLAASAWIAQEEGDIPRSLRLAEQAFHIQRQLTGNRSGDTLRVQTMLAHAYLDHGDLRRALAEFQSIKDLGKTASNYETSDRLVDGYNLARTLFGLGEYAKAKQVLDEVVPQIDRHLGPQHDRTLIVHSLNAQVRAELGEIDEALAEQRLNLESARSRGIDNDEAVAVGEVTLAKLLMTAGRFDEGLPLARSAVEYFDRKYSQANTSRERSRWVLGELSVGAGKAQEGTVLLEQSLAGLQSIATDTNVTPEGQLAIAIALRHGERLHQARDHAKAACSTLTAGLGPDSERTLRCEIVATWLKALEAAEDERGAELRKFRILKERLSPKLHPRHPLRAELLVAESEILHLDTTQSDRADKLLAQGRALYLVLLRQPLPPQMNLIH